MTARANNISFTMRMGNAEAVDAAFARAHHVTRLSLYNNRAHRGDDGAARLHRRVRSRHPPLDALQQHAERARRPPDPGASDPACAGEPHPRRRPRCRRRLWHEGQCLPRGGDRRLGRPPRRPAGQMDPVALRGDARRRPGPRPECQRRAGARRRRQVSGTALDRLAQCRRLYRGRRDRHDRVFAEARLDRLRHPGRGGDEQPRLHQHRADRALSRRRPPRGRLHHGAPRRPGGARDAASTRPSCARRT